MRRTLIVLVTGVALAGSGCGKKAGDGKPAKPGCAQLLKMKKKCHVGKTGTDWSHKYYAAGCAAARTSVAEMTRLVDTCSPKTGCKAFKACYKESNSLESMWYAVYFWAKDTEEQAAKKGKKKIFSHKLFERCEKWDKGADSKAHPYFKQLCAAWLKKVWPKMEAATIAEIKIGMKRWASLPTSYWDMVKLAGKEKEAEPLHTAYKLTEALYKVKLNALKILANHKKYKSKMLTLPTGCGLSHFKKDWRQPKHPLSKANNQSLIRFCYVTMGKAILKNLPRSKGTTRSLNCYARKDVIKGVEHFKLKDAELLALIKKTAKKCKK